MENLLSFVAPVFAVLGEGMYIRSILKRKTRPSFVGWLMFTFLVALVFASAYTLGAHDTLPLLGTFVVMHSITTVLALKYGVVHFSKYNVMSLVLLIVGSFIWWGTDNALYALIIFVSLDALSYTITIKKLKVHPRSEHATAWFLSFIAFSINLMGIDEWVPQEYLYSLSNVILSGCVIYLSLRPRKSPVRKMIRELG
jgi:hypothetical protein